MSRDAMQLPDMVKQQLHDSSLQHCRVLGTAIDAPSGQFTEAKLLHTACVESLCQEFSAYLALQNQPCIILRPVLLDL